MKLAGLQSGVEPVSHRSVDMRFALLLASVAVLSISSAVADPPAATTAPSAVPAQAPTAANDPNKVVCRSKSAPIGSRLGATRECRTQREWDDISAQDRREVEKMQAGGNLAPQGH
jgi:hypothetical protein